MRRAGALLLMVAVSGCHGLRLHPAPPSARETPAPSVAVFAESAQPGTERWVLPQSGVAVAVDRTPVLGSTDLAAVEVVPSEFGRVLALELTPEGAAKLGSLLTGRPRLVLVVDGKAVALRRVERLPADGRVYLNAEVADAELPVIAGRISTALRRR